jgi:hypothetical protein
MDFSVENSVPETKAHSMQIADLILFFSNIFQQDVDLETAACIQKLVSDAEGKTEELKSIARSRIPVHTGSCIVYVNVQNARINSTSW